MGDKSALEAASRLLSDRGIDLLRSNRGADVVAVARFAIAAHERAEKLAAENEQEYAANLINEESLRGALIKQKFLLEKSEEASEKLSHRLTLAAQDLQDSEEKIKQLKNEILMWLGAGAMDRMPYADRSRLQDILGVPKTQVGDT